MLPHRGSGLGWLAVVICLLGRLLVPEPSSDFDIPWERWWERQLYGAVAFGSVAAIAVGLGLWVARVGRPQWVGWVAIVVGGAIAVEAVVQIARWL